MPKLLSIYNRTWENFRPWAIPWTPLPKTPFHASHPTKVDNDKSLVPDDLPEVRPLDLLIPYHPARQLGKEVVLSSSSEPPKNSNPNHKNEPFWRRHRVLVVAIAIILAGGTISGGIIAGFIATRPPQQPQSQGQSGGVDPLNQDANNQYIYPGLSTLPLIVTRTIKGTTETVTLTKTPKRTSTPKARTTTSGFDVVITTPTAVAAGADTEGVIPSETGVM